MPLFLGIDVGTTKIAVVLLDSESGLLRSVQSTPNLSRQATPPERSEWDADSIVRTVLDLSRAVVTTRDRAEIAGIGVTGQMHGAIIVDSELRPVTPLIGWQDKRASVPDQDSLSTLDWMRQRVDEQVWLRTGCRLAPGFLGTTLVWLARHQQLPEHSAVASFVPDLVVAHLVGRRPVTDPTNAGGSGIFDVVNRRWDAELVDALALPAELLPEVRPSGTIVGTLVPTIARQLGLPEGVPVVNGVGDNQASFFGSVGQPDSDLLINIGTGGQISATNERYVTPGVLETRCHVDGRYLLVGAGIVGGTAYAAWRDFVRQVGETCFGIDTSVDLYPILNRLAAEVPAGSDGLRCDPRFAGTRPDPGQRGHFDGISLANFTPGHFARAVLEGVAESFAEQYKLMERTGLPARSRLIGSGNGIRRNPLLGQILATRFGMPLVTPSHLEEAAYGAALVAAVATKALPSPEAAGALIHYQPT